MAITLNTNSLVGSFDPNIVDGGPGTVLREAQGNDQEALNRIAGGSGTSGGVTFKAKATSTTAVNALNVISLKANGVTFPVDTVRLLRVRAWVRKLGADKAGYSESVFTVVGKGATTAPVLTPSTAPSGNGLGNDPRYVVRVPIVGHANVLGQTPSYVGATLTIVSTDVAVRVSTLTGSGLTTGGRFDVEVEVGPLHVMPSA